MLFLTRKKGEALQINDTITLVVVDIKRTHIKFGLEFGANDRILRKEVYDRIRAANAEAGDQTISFVQHILSPPDPTGEAK